MSDLTEVTNSDKHSSLFDKELSCNNLNQLHIFTWVKQYLILFSNSELTLIPLRSTPFIL